MALFTALPRRLVVVALSACAAGALPAQSTLFHFGGDYVAATQPSAASLVNLAGAPGANDSIRQVGGFNTAANPTIGLNYSGPAFNGGSQIVKFGLNSTTGAATVQVVDDAVNGDYISLFSQSPAGTTSSHLNMFVSWNIAPTAYGAIGSIQGVTAGGVSTSVISRILLQSSGGTLYLSETSIAGGNLMAPWGISDMAAEKWATFTPGAQDWRGDFGALAFNETLPAELEFVAVGWFASRVAAGGSTNSTLTVRSFDVMGAPIPEPSTYALLAGMGAIALVVLRRRRPQA